MFFQIDEVPQDTTIPRRFRNHQDGAEPVDFRRTPTTGNFKSTDLPRTVIQIEICGGIGVMMTPLIVPMFTRFEREFECSVRFPSVLP
jgi:hypothetical protein